MVGEHRGFSLIELMIVVVIIALMAMLTIPSMTDTLAEGRLYASARSVTEALTFARIQAIMRNQAHEVSLELSPNHPGGKLQVFRHAANSCSNVMPGVVMQAEIEREIALTRELNEKRVEVNLARICFKPNGRASDAATGNPLLGEIFFELRRFERALGGQTVGWPLYARLNNMGIASLAKSLPSLSGG